MDGAQGLEVECHAGNTPTQEFSRKCAVDPCLDRVRTGRLIQQQVRGAQAAPGIVRRETRAGSQYVNIEMRRRVRFVEDSGHRPEQTRVVGECSTDDIARRGCRKVARG